MEVAAGSAFFPIDIEQEDAEEERQRAERDSGDVAALKQHIARLEQRVQSQEAAFNEASQRFLQKKTRAQTRQRELQNTVEQLVKRVEAQNTLLEEERARFQTKQASAKQALTQLSESFNALLPQVQGILDGDESAAEPPGDPSGNEGQDRPPAPQQPIPIDHDLEQAQQAKDALAAYREVTQRYFMQREELLTCPISFDLFDDPVTTSCCGKTFSNESLRMTFASYPICPVCRTRVLTTTRSRDVAALVELHQQERTAVEGLENAPAQEPEAATENAVAPAARQQNARQSANREHRTARAGARSATTRRQRGRRAPQ